jgi:uncharacterized protein YgiB involved in biofilm formation
MLKRVRKSSLRVTLVLAGVAALAGCDQERRDVYATREDCLADWGNKAEDCRPATEPAHASRGFWYGPSYRIPFGHSSSHWVSGTRSIGSARAGSSSSSHVSRGGFGSTAHSSGG